jgi:tRNA uridine 5-carboxymethylaminomethyl modification enzyme
LANSLSDTPNALKKHGLSVNQDGVRRSAFELLAYPGVTVANLLGLWPELGQLPADLVERLEIEALYSSYVRRQTADVAAFRRDETLMLPNDLDYSNVGGLSREAQGKLALACPETLGQAGRIPGVTPAALVALLRYVRHGATESARSLKSA